MDMEFNENDLFSSEMSSGVSLEEDFYKDDIQSMIVKQKRKEGENVDEIDQMIALEKKKALMEIETDVQALSEVMQDTQKIISEQSPLLDEVEYSLEETKNYSSEAVSSLNKAENSFWTGAIAAAGFLTAGFVLALSTQKHRLPQIGNMLGTSSNENQEQNPDPKNGKTQ